MNCGGKKIESICKYVPSIMTLTYTETEKYHEVSEVYHKVNEAKIWVKSKHGWCYWNDAAHM